MQRRRGQPAHNRIVSDRSPRIVVPAGDAEYRHRDSIEPPLDAQPAPVDIVLLVIEPVVPILRTSTARLLRLLDDGQVIEGLDLADVADVRHRVLHRCQAEPRDDGGREDHVDVGDNAQRVGGGHGRGNRGEVRRMSDRGVPRVEPRVGGADDSNPSVAARQRRRPLDGVVSVLLLHGVHVEHTARTAAAANVLLHIDVASRRPELAVRFVGSQIRRALEDDAEGTVACRPRDVVHERGAVACRHGNGGIDGDLERRLRDVTRPELVVRLPDEGTGPLDEPHAIDRFAAAMDLARNRVPVHGGSNLLAVAEREREIGASEHDLRDRVERSAAATLQPGAIGRRTDEVDNAHPPARFESTARRRTERDVIVPITGQTGINRCGRSTVAADRQQRKEGKGRPPARRQEWSHEPIVSNRRPSSTEKRPARRELGNVDRVGWQNASDVLRRRTSNQKHRAHVPAAADWNRTQLSHGICGQRARDLAVRKCRTIPVGFR